MADRHYTRQTKGAALWTRPGYNLPLYAQFPEGEALFCYWRPKWEAGIPGTERKDKLRVIECTMFRREGLTPISSQLIRDATDFLHTAEAKNALRLHVAGPIDHLVTGVRAAATQKRRGKGNPPGYCFICAGWIPFEKKTPNADIWLFLPWQNPFSLYTKAKALIDSYDFRFSTSPMSDRWHEMASKRLEIINTYAAASVEDRAAIKAYHDARAPHDFRILA